MEDDHDIRAPLAVVNDNDGERARKRVRERSCGREGDGCREGGRR